MSREPIEPVFVELTSDVSQAKWTDAPDEPIDHQQDEKTIIDTWSSVLEDNTPTISSIALSSKLSPNAPEFTPSHPPNHEDKRNHQSPKPKNLQNHPSIVRKECKTRKGKEILRCFRNCSTKKVEHYQPEPEPIPVQQELNVWHSIPQGKTYADILLEENGQPIEQTQTEPKRKHSDKKSKKPEKKLIASDDSDESDKSIKKQKKRVKQKTKIIEEKRDRISSDETLNEAEPNIPDVTEKTTAISAQESKPLEATNAVSWASLVKKPGEWIDDISQRKKSPVRSPERPIPHQAKSVEHKLPKPKKEKPQRKHDKPMALKEEGYAKPIDKDELISKKEAIQQPSQNIPENLPKSNTLTWAKIVSQIDHMTDDIKPKVAKNIKPITIASKLHDSPKLPKDKAVTKPKTKDGYQDIDNITNVESVASSWIEIIDDEELSPWREMIDDEHVTKPFSVPLEILKEPLDAQTASSDQEPKKLEKDQKEPIPTVVEPVIVTEQEITKKDLPKQVTLEFNQTQKKSEIIEEVKYEKPADEPKKPSYAGLPIDESSTAWMNVMDEPMVLSDEEEVENQISAAEINQPTVTDIASVVDTDDATKKHDFAGLPIDRIF
ncbi:hypothetical protein EVAR_72192_1 [Eumeta japonica]|uniref:Uncharacterized protein n=1 Tax=Eumeta variegata TaxID=151549 RepID=A0A4C1SRP3_EUMVA|nr:hypothetical protein EVAR_72192_1 [Eumeta japonica]